MAEDASGAADHVEEGETAQGAATPPVWDVQSNPLSRAALLDATRRTLEALLAASKADQRAFLCDSRAVHRGLFLPFAPGGYEVYAGNYRGLPDSPLEKRRTAVFFRNVEGLKERDPAAPPHLVAERMAALAAFTAETLDYDYDPRSYFPRCAKIFADFCKIHPYLDGNGHIVRMMLVLLAKRRGLGVRPGWTVHPRPYSHAMGICLQNNKAFPELLEQYLKRWFYTAPESL